MVTGGTPRLDGKRQLPTDGTSRMTRERPVRFCGAFLGTLFMACLYGGFVSSIIWSPPRLLSFVGLHLFVGSLHLVLFVLLMLLCYDILIGHRQTL